MSMFSDAVIDFWLNTGDAKKQLDGLQGMFVKTADKIQNNFIAKLGGLAVGGAGIKGLTNVYDEALKIQNLAESWNLPVEKVSSFANAFSLLGGNTDDALGAIDKLQNLSSQLKFDSSGPLRELSAVIGTNLFNKDYQGAIDALRKNFNSLNSDAQKKVVDMLGVDNLPFLRMLKQSDEEYEETNRKAAEFGTLTERGAEAIRKMEISLSTIRQAFKAIAYPALEKLAPILDKISEGLGMVAGATPEVKAGIVAIAGAITLLPPLLKTTGSLFGSVFSASTVGLGAIAAAAYLLYTNWDKVTAAVKDYLAESPRLQEAISAIGELFSGLAGILQSLYGWLVENFDAFLDFFKSAGGFFEKTFGKIFSGAEALGGAIAGLVSGEGVKEGAIAGFQTPDDTKNDKIELWKSSGEENTQIENLSPDKPGLAAPDYAAPVTQTRINNTTAVAGNQTQNSTVNIGTIALPNVTNARQFTADMERMSRAPSSVAQNYAGGVQI